MRFLFNFFAIIVLLFAVTGCSSNEENKTEDEKTIVDTQEPTLEGNLEILITEYNGTKVESKVKTVDCRTLEDFCVSMLQIQEEYEEQIASGLQDISTMKGCPFSYSISGIVDDKSIDFFGDCNATTLQYGEQIKTLLFNTYPKWEALEQWN